MERAQTLPAPAAALRMGGGRDTLFVVPPALVQNKELPGRVNPRLLGPPLGLFRTDPATLHESPWCVGRSLPPLY